MYVCEVVDSLSLLFYACDLVSRLHNACSTDVSGAMKVSHPRLALDRVPKAGECAFNGVPNILSLRSPVSGAPEGQSVSWADQMDDLEASTITAGIYILGLS